MTQINHLESKLVAIKRRSSSSSLRDDNLTRITLSILKIDSIDDKNYHVILCSLFERNMPEIKHVARRNYDLIAPQ